MSNFEYMSRTFSLTDTNHVARGHNKKFTITIGKESYFFKYDAEKEILGNMQKRFASCFCSFLTEKYGGNFVIDIPGEAFVDVVPKEHSTTKLKGLYSRSYKEDYHIGITFTLDEVLKPRENEQFVYNNENRVFSSVENAMNRLRSYIVLQQEKDKHRSDFSLYTNFKDLEADYEKIQNDLVGIVLLDYLFVNNDRHTENIEFSVIFDDNHDFHLVVSPVFDNDRTFGLDKDEKTIKEDCANPIKREIYTNYGADVKFVIRNKDCDTSFALEMSFANNYHSDVIADYIRNTCLNNNGEINRSLLMNNPVYQLYQSYKDIDIKKEFYEFLSQVASIENPYSPNITREQEEAFVSEFNNKTDSTLSIYHIMELTQNFNSRQSKLNESMQSKLPQMDNTPTTELIQ